MLCYRLSVVIVLCCYLCCSVIMVLFYVLIVCTVTLPPGVNPIAVDKYIYPAMYCRIPENRTVRAETCEHINGLSTSINGEKHFHLLNDY